MFPSLQAALLSEPFERRVALIWDLWPLVSILTAAIVFAFVYWVEGKGWGRLQKLLLQGGFAVTAIILFVSPGGFLFGLAWLITSALSHDLHLVYTITLASTLIPIALFVYLTTRRRMVGGRD